MHRPARKSNPEMHGVYVLVKPPFGHVFVDFGLLARTVESLARRRGVVGAGNLYPTPISSAQELALE